MKNYPVVITEPAAVAALKEIYRNNGPGNLEWDFSIPGQVTARDGRLKARDGALLGLDLSRAELKGTLKLRGVETLTIFKDYGNHNLGETVFEDLPELAEGVKWLRQAAEQGDSEARLNLGLAYSRGRGVEKDPAEAVKWFRLAAVQGHTLAQFYMSGAYFVGLGVEKDKAESVKWLRLAAEQGNALAQLDLSQAYYDGEGVEKDKAEGLKWYRLGAEQGDLDAQLCLACAYGPVLLGPRR